MSLGNVDIPLSGAIVNGARWFGSLFTSGIMLCYPILWSRDYERLRRCDQYGDY